MDVVKIQHIGGKISEISNAKRVVFADDNWVYIERNGNTLVVNADTVECVSIPQTVCIVM